MFTQADRQAAQKERMYRNQQSPVTHMFLNAHGDLHVRLQNGAQYIFQCFDDEWSEVIALYERKFKPR